VSNRIIGLETHDVRFPTSRHLDGSDAMNPFPDYSAAYVVLRTTDGEEGFGFVFTTGRGNDVQLAGIRALETLVLGLEVDAVLGDLGAFGRLLTGDSQLRWLGPDKGVIHMAAGAVINAAWDLKGRREGQPVWKVLADLTPEQVVALVDFRYLRDALTEQEALDILRKAQQGRGEREKALLDEGYPAYTTTPGWLGYDDDKLARLSAEAQDDGFALIKLKVGASQSDDLRRLQVARAAVGPDLPIAIDANQVWGVEEAIAWVHALDGFGLYWIEEPTSPDDILGHAAVRRAVAPVRVATGEHVQNAVMFKQLLQAGAVDVVQIDACRVGGVNENVAILLLAAKFGIPVCPHAGGVGLCELVQHLSMFDFLSVSATADNRMVEYVDHLHEHFVDPVVIRDGHYVAPLSPGMGARMHEASIEQYSFPHGSAWVDPTPPPAAAVGP
jgi:L-fuconate dehydratase